MHTSRVVTDRTREPWTVEECSAQGNSRVLRFRHEMGYELAVVADRPLADMRDRTLERMLEELRHRAPRSPADAA